jgi:hypothetical protein
MVDTGGWVCTDKKDIKLTLIFILIHFEVNNR